MLLIVDENKQVRRLLRSMVEDLETEILECADGEEAVSACALKSPDWILMDVRMSPIDGLTATRRIRTFLPAARIVIVTDYSDAKTGRAAIEAGAEFFFGKEDLTKIRDLIAGRETS